MGQTAKSKTRTGNPKLTTTQHGNLQPTEFVNHKLLEAIDGVSPEQAPIIEIFRTIEGEGNHIGTPRVLVRFGGCAVGCVWCDTPHSWALKTASVLKSLDEVEAEIVNVAQGFVKEVSFTGGEPMHYPRQLLELTRRLRRRGFRLSVETSGLIFNSVVFNEFDYVSMDIKTPSSRVPVTTAMIREYRRLWDEHPGVQFKCVILNQGDLDWVNKYLSRFFKSDAKIRRPLILTPGVVATKKEANLGGKLADIVDTILNWNKGYNVRVIAQQHALLNYR